LKRKYYLTYSKELVKEPFIYQIGKEFQVKTNIRQASISEDLGIVALELEGEADEIEKAVKFFVDKGVKVEPIELDVIE
jgi:ABC-type methionine transport system ATPase subunit